MHQRITRFVLLLFAVISIYGSIVPTPKAYGITSEANCSEEYLRDVGAVIINCAGDTNQCQTGNGQSFTSNPTDSSVFFIGDSLTVGMVGIGGLLEKAQSAGLKVAPDYQQLSENGQSSGQNPTYRGPSVEATVGFDISQTSRKLEQRKTDIAAVDTIVIGLGTNAGASGLNNYSQRVFDFIGELRVINPAARFVWINTYFNDPSNPQHKQINPAISSGIEGLKNTGVSISIIDVEEATESGALLAPNGDRIHFNTSGYNSRADWLIAKLSGPNGQDYNTGAAGNGSGSTPASGCVCPANSSPISLNASAEERFSFVWGFFVTTKRLSADAAAGLMGNLQAESGIDPQNMQNNAPLPDSPSMPTRTVGGELFPAAAIEGKYGYGIAQWTSAGRQKGLIDFATQAGKSSGDLGLQLDFLWQELNQKYSSVLAKLQTPGVTLQEASDEVVLRFEIPRSVLVGAAAKEETLRERAGLGLEIKSRFGQSAGSYSPTASCSEGSDGRSSLINSSAENQVTECAPGTQDSGETQGYINGKLIQLRLCKIPDINQDVNAQISKQVLGLVNAAKSSGVKLRATDGFRTLEGQIKNYEKWCGFSNLKPTPGPYPKETIDGVERCPGAAAPGYSNHGAGYAIDFIIPQSYEAARNTPEFRWLEANAKRYGLYEWGKGETRSASGYEAWHWSIDGN